jgi:hypothetical protein
MSRKPIEAEESEAPECGRPRCIQAAKVSGLLWGMALVAGLMGLMLTLTGWAQRESQLASERVQKIEISTAASENDVQWIRESLQRIERDMQELKRAQGKVGNP